MTRKIDIYAKTFDFAGYHATGRYLCSTSQAKTCREAIARFIATPAGSGYAGSDLTARFAK